jgi:hypothetical protein
MRREATIGAKIIKGDRDLRKPQSGSLAERYASSTLWKARAYPTAHGRARLMRVLAASRARIFLKRNAVLLGPMGGREHRGTARMYPFLAG